MQAIRERRSIRKFLPDPVDENELREIIEAATLAPNAENRQDWYFVAVTNKELIQRIYAAVSIQVDAIVSACQTLSQGEAFANHKYFLTFFKDAPALIAAFACPATNSIDRAFEIIHAEFKTPIPLSPVQQSIGTAVQNISLVAHEKGYGTTCMFGPVLAYREIGRLLDVAEPWVLSALLPIGKPGHHPNARPRKPLDEVYKLIR